MARYVTAASVGTLAGLALSVFLLVACEATDGMKVIDPGTRHQFAPLVAVGAAAVGAVSGVIVRFLLDVRGPR